MVMHFSFLCENHAFLKNKITTYKQKKKKIEFTSVSTDTQKIAKLFSYVFF